MKNLYRFWASAFLLALQSGIWMFVWIVFYSSEVPRQIYWKGHLLVSILYFVILLAVNNFYGGLQIGYHRVSDVALSGWISLCFANTITWVQVCLIGSAIMTLIPILLMTLIQCMLIWLWALITDKIYIRIVPPHRMLLLCSGQEYAKAFIQKLITRSEKYLVKESIDVSGMEQETIFARVLKYESVILAGLPPEIHRSLQEFCFKYSIRVYTIPEIGDILTRGAVEINLFDTPLLLNRNHGLSENQQLVKRIFDILISGILLIVFSPFMLITALAVKLYDGGSIIYTQERLTLEGRRFTLYKFRSMKVRAEENGARLSTINDDRVTPIGRIIRAIRFDELPQILNILKGDMSLVGPRPERPELVEEYIKTIPEFDYRLKVKAGLTGYAQVYGKYNTNPQDKLLMDLIYISSYSLSLDLKIMLTTVKTLLQRDRTDGVFELPKENVNKKTAGETESQSRRS